MLGDIFFLCAGLGGLIVGAEVLIRGGSRLAAIWGLRPIIIGLTVVAFGTSAPEAVVSVLAGLREQSDVAMGNVVGSNIFNIAAILGLASLIRPLAVQADSIRREVPFAVGSAVLLWVLCIDGRLGVLDGLLLLGCFAFFNAMVFRWVRSADEANTRERGSGGVRSSGGLCLLGLALLVAGAHWFVDGSVALARAWGVSELFIGLTIVAAGTSLPELATSVMGAVRGKDDLAIGNVVGSNIFNILLILGLAAMIHPLTVAPSLLRRDIPVMIALTLVLVPVMRSGFRISRLEGCLLVAAYGTYLYYASVR
ncbi:MAG: calcium/sodium antiporter [Elusimicrobiota bacterium]